METKVKALGKLSNVLELALRRHTEGLEVLMKLREEETCLETQYSFLDVSDLRFRSEQTDLIRTVLLLVEDIRDRGMESARFFVKDYEEEFVSFYCRQVLRDDGTTIGS